MALTETKSTRNRFDATNTPNTDASDEVTIPSRTQMVESLANGGKNPFGMKKEAVWQLLADHANLDEKGESKLFRTFQNEWIRLQEEIIQKQTVSQGQGFSEKAYGIAGLLLTKANYPQDLWEEKFGQEFAQKALRNLTLENEKYSQKLTGFF